MTSDPISQFLDLRKTLQAERAAILQRLARIDSVLSPAQTPSLTPAPARPSTPASPSPAKPARRKRFPRKPGQLSLKDTVRQLTAAKPLTKDEILAALKKEGRQFAPGSLDVALYAKGNFKRVGEKFCPPS